MKYVEGFIVGAVLAIIVHLLLLPDYEAWVISKLIQDKNFCVYAFNYKKCYDIIEAKELANDGK